MLNIVKKLEDDALTLELEGRLDTNAAGDLEKVLKDELDYIDSLVFDMEKLDYVSSAGLRVLLFALKSMKGRGNMKLIHVSETIMEIFEVTGFSDILTIE